jgi:hypothetical protein
MRDTAKALLLGLSPAALFVPLSLFVSAPPQEGPRPEPLTAECITTEELARRITVDSWDLEMPSDEYAILSKTFVVGRGLSQQYRTVNEIWSQEGQSFWCNTSQGHSA